MGLAYEGEKMDRGLITIGKPKIRNEQNKTVLYASVNDNGQKKELTYIVDERYGCYLTTERSDAFVTSLLYHAMVKGYDIKWETPCTGQLIYQLETYYIPVCSKEIPFMKQIKLQGATTKENLICAGAVGTGFSCGVDSSYTLHKYLNTKYPDYTLTHVVFTDCFTADKSREYQEEFLEQNYALLPPRAEELGVEFIFIQHNVDKNFSIGRFKDKTCGDITDGGLYCLKYCSLAMALKKLFGCYYFASGFPMEQFSFQKYDSAYYDSFTLPMISTDALKFYSDGMEVSRLKKLEAIADWDFAQKYLQVCAWDQEGNCGRCEKCIRTMSELYSIGKLELYSKRFPTEDYKKHMNQRWAYVLMQARRKHYFEAAIIKNMKSHGKKIPVMAYFLELFYSIMESVRIRLKNIRWARRIYRKYHLDKVLYGRSTEKYEQTDCK